MRCVANSSNQCVFHLITHGRHFASVAKRRKIFEKERSGNAWTLCNDRVEQLYIVTAKRKDNLSRRLRIPAETLRVLYCIEGYRIREISKIVGISERKLIPWTNKLYLQNNLDLFDDIRQYEKRHSEKYL